MALPHCQCSALWYGLVQLATGKVTSVHIGPSCSCMEGIERDLKVQSSADDENRTDVLQVFSVKDRGLGFKALNESEFDVLF